MLFCGVVGDARRTLADATHLLGPSTVSLANLHGFTTRRRLSGPHRKTFARPSVDRELHATVFYRAADINICGRQMWMESRRVLGTCSRLLPPTVNRLCWRPFGTPCQLVCVGYVSFKIQMNHDINPCTPTITEISCNPGGVNT